MTRKWKTAVVIAVAAAKCRGFVTTDADGSSLRKRRELKSNFSFLAKTASVPFAGFLNARPTKIAVAPEENIHFYDHNGWTLSYRHKAASQGYEQMEPILLIHPVGVGLSSWFWNNFFEEWKGPALYAPDLIGCGIQNGGDSWDPQERPLSFPLGWSKGCEALLEEQSHPSKYVVVAQGGLAPVAILLASRCPHAVSKLVLASPPTWEDMVTPIPEKEISQNYKFLTSKILGNLAFGLLESRWAIEFFSNLILFESGRCDQDWLDYTEQDSSYSKMSRTPVQAFNAGFCRHRSFQEELQTLTQPTLILSGTSDRRAIKRQPYESNMLNCALQTIPGQNVLPWESTTEFCKALHAFIEK